MLDRPGQGVNPRGEPRGDSPSKGECFICHRPVLSEFGYVVFFRKGVILGLAHPKCVVQSPNLRPGSTESLVPIRRRSTELSSGDITGTTTKSE